MIKIEMSSLYLKLEGGMGNQLF
jgi:hypothetical protein